MKERVAKPYGELVEGLVAERSVVLSQARALDDMGLDEMARPLRSCAASYEERIAPWLDVLSRDAEAALQRVSGATGFEKCREWGRAANLYRAALGGPLTDEARADVERKLSSCLENLRQAAIQPAT